MKFNKKVRDLKFNEFVDLLNENGYYYLRRGNGSHVIYYNEKTKTKFSFPKKSLIQSGIVWNFLRNHTTNNKN